LWLQHHTHLSMMPSWSSSRITSPTEVHTEEDNTSSEPTAKEPPTRLNCAAQPDSSMYALIFSGWLMQNTYTYMVEANNSSRSETRVMHEDIRSSTVRDVGEWWYEVFAASGVHVSRRLKPASRGYTLAWAHRPTERAPVQNKKRHARK